MAERSLAEPITLVGGVPSWLLVALPAAHGPDRQVDRRRGLARPGGRRPRRGQVRPLPRGVRRGPRRPVDPAPGDVPLLRGVHRLRRPRRRACSGWSSTTGSSTSSCRSTSWARTGRPGTGWATSEVGRRTTRSSSRPARGSGRTSSATRSGSSRLDPPLLTFTGPDEVHALGLRRAPDQRGDRGGGGLAASATGASVRDWHVGPVFRGALGHHRYVVEFLRDARRPRRRSAGRSTPTSSRRNAHYLAHRAEGVGLPLPAVLVVRPGGFDDWMRSRGKLGGQHKVPRMDGSGRLTDELVAFLRAAGRSRPRSRRAPPA